MKDKQRNELILDVYECASDPGLWPNTLDKISNCFRARGCIVFEWDAQHKPRNLYAPLMSTNYNRELLETYLSEFAEYEERDQNIYEVQSLQIDSVDVVGEEILYEDEREYRSRPNVQQLAKYGIYHRLGSMLDKDNPYRSRFSLQLGKTRGALSQTEYHELSLLLPNMAKSLGIGQQMTLQRAHWHNILAVFDQLSIGVCLLKRSGHVVASNLEFQRQVETYDGLSVSNNGIFEFHSSEAKQKLSAMLKSLAAHGTYGARPRKEAIVLGPNLMEAGLCIELIPLNKSSELGTHPFGGTLMISRDTSQPLQLNVDLVRYVYGFTSAEIEVVELIAEGLKNQDIAEKRDVTLNTVHSQIKTILNKARAMNRTQLVRLLSAFSWR